jgi:DNA-directed RNA polymerase subunit RPC12/RpoP
VRTTSFYRVRASLARSETNVGAIIDRLTRTAAEGAPLPVSVTVDGVHATLALEDPKCIACGRPFEPIELAQQVMTHRYRFACPRCGRGVYVHDGASSLAASWRGRLELVITDDDLYAAGDGLIHCVRCDASLARAGADPESSPALEAHQPCPVHPAQRADADAELFALGDLEP